MQPKNWDLCFIRWEFLGLQGWKTASPKKRWERQPWENCSEEVRGAFKVIQKFYNKGQVIWTSKVFLGVRENQISQVKEFSAFLCVGRCKSLGSLKSFLSHAPQLSGASVSCIFTPEFLSVHCGSGCSLIGARSWVFFSFLSALGAQKFSFGGLELMVTVTCLFTDNGRIYFILRTTCET